jgi:hypothetical protein
MQERTDTEADSQVYKEDNQNFISKSHYQQLADLKMYNFEQTERMQKVVQDEINHDSVTNPESQADTYAEGDFENFWVADNYLFDSVAKNWDETMYEVNASVVKVTDHAYIFQDVEENVNPSKLDAMANVFENTIYSVETDLFGQPPDIDNNDRIIILVLDIRDRKWHQSSYPYYIAGYFWSLHTYAPTGDPSELTYYSEYKEIIHIDIQSFTSNIDQDTVAHEYQHLLHYAQDPDETVWLDEGMAVLAEYLCGYTDGWLPYVQDSAGFMNNPTTSLTYWEELYASYGVVFCFMLMIQQKFGNGTVKDIVSARDGVTDDILQGMKSVVEITGTEAEDLFAEFTYRNVINDISKGYGYGSFTTKAKKSYLASLNETKLNEGVPYWATRYYGLPNTVDTGILNATVRSGDTDNITASMLVLNQSGYYEAFMVKKHDESVGELLLNNYGTEYTDGILVIFSTSGTDSGWEVETPGQDNFDVMIQMINLEVHYGNVSYEMTSYSETITFNNITVKDTLTGKPWVYTDVLIPDSSSVIVDLNTGEDVPDFTGLIQWNDTCSCWQVYFDNITSLEGGTYFVEVILVTNNASVIIKSEPFEILRLAILDSGSGDFINAVLSYSGIKVGYSNGTAWLETIDAHFQLFFVNDSLILEGSLLWSSVDQSWHLPAVNNHFNLGDEVYLVFSFEYMGETLVITSEVLINENGVTEFTPGLTGYLSIVVIAILSISAILVRKKGRNR